MPFDDSSLPRGVRRLFRLPRTRARMLRDLDDELAAHFAMRVDDLRAQGLSEDAAIAETRRRFGDASAFRAYAERRVARKSRALDVRDWLGGWWQDLRFARRQIAAAPTVATIAMLTLALGIGANTAIFSVVHRLLLAPLPYPNGGRIVMPVRAPSDELRGRVSIGGALAEAWRDDGRTAQEVAAASENLFSARADGTIDTLPLAEVTTNFLGVLGVRPILGRGFVPDDAPADDAKGTVALIGFELWQSTFGGRPDIVGQRVEDEGHPLVIVGVLPAGVRVPLSPNRPPAIWTPASLRRAAGGGSGATVGPASVFATLRRGVTLDAATRDLQRVARAAPPEEGPFRAFRQATPDRLRVARAQDFLDAREARAVQILFAAVGALLLIACANVANLLLARAWTRQREFAVRSALGAGRRRLARQVLSESVVLALGGGALGVGVAWAALRVIVALRPPALDHLADVRLEPVVLLWSLGVSIGTGILFGCAPALLAGVRATGDVLRRETRGGSAGRGATRLRAGLIVLEVAASLVLLVGAGLLVRSFDALQRMPLGFEPRKLVFVEALLGGGRTRERRPALRAAVEARLRALPGVTDISFGIMPGKGWTMLGGIEAEREPGGPTTPVAQLGVILMSPGYFRVTRIPLLEGRLPDTTLAAGQGVAYEVVVNRALAHRLAPDGHVIGMRLREARQGAPPDAPPATWNTIVGVVGDTRMPNLTGDAATFQMYRPLTLQFGDVGYMVRTTMSGDVAAPAIKRAVASVDPVIYVRDVLSGDTFLRDGLAPTRFAMALLTAFAAVAVLLAAVGLYGVVAYAVSQRTRELGVRVALGAEPRALVRQVVVDGVGLALAGVAVGTALALAATRVLRGMLYEVGPGDPVTFVAIAALVALVALLASYVPARRALRIDPVVTLRAD